MLYDAYSRRQYSARAARKRGCLLAYSLLKHAHEIRQFFTAVKKDNFQLKYCDVFLIFAQNIDCGYTLEPPH